MNRLLAILAHPDDETFRPGGTLALLATSGARVHILTATRGEAGSCGDPRICSREELPAVRVQELHCACEALGLEPPTVLDHPDGELANVESTGLFGHVLSAVEAVQPQVILTFGPEGLSGHPDHVVIGQIASEAFRQRQDISALYYMAVPASIARLLKMPYVHPVPDESITLRVDVGPVWEKKQTAMRCHATQWTSSPMRLSSLERQRAFFGVEHFVRAGLRAKDRDMMERLLKEG